MQDGDSLPEAHPKPIIVLVEETETYDSRPPLNAQRFQFFQVDYSKEEKRGV
jgi:hypothetical protein